MYGWACICEFIIGLIYVSRKLNIIDYLRGKVESERKGILGPDLGI